MSDSLALAYAMKRRSKKMADGGMVQKEHAGTKEPAVEPGSDTDKAFKSIRAAFGNPDSPPVRKATGGIVEAIRAKRSEMPSAEDADMETSDDMGGEDESDGDVDAILKELYEEEAAESGSEDAGHTDMISSIRRKLKAKGLK